MNISILKDDGKNNKTSTLIKKVSASVKFLYLTCHIFMFSNIVSESVT